MRNAPMLLWLRYGLPGVVVPLAAAMQFICPQLSPPGNPFFFFIFAVLLAAWFGGFGPGVLATVLSVLVIDQYFLSPRSLFVFNSFSENFWLAGMALGGGMVSFLCGIRLKERENLKAHLGRHEAIMSLGRIALHGAEPDMVRTKALELVARTLSVRHVALIEAGAHAVAAGGGCPGRNGGDCGVGPGGDSLAGHAMACRAAILSDDLARDGRFELCPYARREGLASGIGAAITSPNHTWGVLEALSPRRGAFDSEDLMFLQAIAHMFALTLERHHTQQVQASLHASAEKQRQLFLTVADNAALGIALFSGADLRLKWHNPAYREIFVSLGLEANLAGRTLEEILPQARELGLRETFLAVAESGQPHFNPEFEFHGDSGAVSYWYWNLRPLPAEAGGAPDLLLMIVEVTETILSRQRIERQAAQTQASLNQLQAIVGSMNEGLIIIDQDGDILLMNSAALRMFDFEKLAEARRNLEDLEDIFDIRTLDGIRLPPEEWPLARALRGESFSGVELQVRRRDTGRGIIASINGTPVRDAEGRILMAVQSMRDVTRQKESELERELLEADLRQHAEELTRMNQAKDEFLAMLSHELRNPLAPIASALHIMESHAAGGDAAVQRAMAIVERQTRHMAHLLDDLLDASRITRGRIALHPEPLDLAAAVRHAVEDRRPQIENGCHALELRLPAEAVWVQADPARLEQIIVNLLSNAAKYTPAGGRIEIELTPGATEACLAVRDNGIGISPEMLPRIFELFTQEESSLDRSQGGLGIGLTLVQRLAEMHGGRIEAHSEGPGRGSQFILHLPRLEAPPAPAAGDSPAPAAVHEPPPDGRSRRVLIVEDNADTAQAMGEMLELWGHDVRLAYDGPGALDVALVYHPEVILLDIGLPGMDGYQVSRALRQDSRFQQTMIIAITGYGQDEDIRHSREVGIDHHFTKPVDLTALRHLLGD